MRLREQTISAARETGNSVHRACGRLTSAVAQLEEAVEAARTADRARHARELEDAQAELTVLRHAQEAIIDRLDAAIHRLRRIVGE
jgi:hypothetical protein